MGDKDGNARGAFLLLNQVGQGLPRLWLPLPHSVSAVRPPITSSYAASTAALYGNLFPPTPVGDRT